MHVDLEDPLQSHACEISSSSVYVSDQHQNKYKYISNKYTSIMNLMCAFIRSGVVTCYEVVSTLHRLLEHTHAGSFFH